MWPSEVDKLREPFFARETMPDVIGPHGKTSGFVLRHREGGVKFLRARFIGPGQQFDFRFAIPLGKRTYAVQDVDFNTLPLANEAVDLTGIRAKI
jgi:hypothetical protein